MKNKARAEVPTFSYLPPHLISNFHVIPAFCWPTIKDVISNYVKVSHGYYFIHQLLRLSADTMKLKKQKDKMRP